jgi:hypothetical protein
MQSHNKAIMMERQIRKNKTGAVLLVPCADQRIPPTHRQKHVHAKVNQHDQPWFGASNVENHGKTIELEAICCNPSREGRGKVHDC